MQPTNEELFARVRTLERLFRIFVTGLVLLVSTLILRVLMSVGWFEQIFEEMLGSKDALPGATNFLLDHTLKIVIVYNVICVVAVISIWVERRRAWPLYSAVGFVLASIFLWGLLVRVLLAPLARIIQGMSGG